DFEAVICDECFAPDTKIQVIRKNKLLNIYIKDCLIGDKVLNCTGLDTITAIKTKKIPYAIRIKYNGKEVISSPRHPYFTQRGWIAAKDIQRGDFIMSTDKAMRILRGEIYDSQEIPTENKVLRDILLSEVENETTGIFNEGSQSGSSSEKREKQIKVVENRRREKTSGTNKNSKSNEQSGNEGKGISYIKSDETQTFSAWGKWSRNDITAAINEGCVVRK